MPSMFLGLAGSLPTQISAKKQTLKRAASRSLDKLLDLTSGSMSSASPSSNKSRFPFASRASSSPSNRRKSVRARRISYPTLVSYDIDVRAPSWNSWGLRSTSPSSPRVRRKESNRPQSCHVPAMLEWGVEEDETGIGLTYGEEKPCTHINMSSRFSTSFSTLNATFESLIAGSERDLLSLEGPSSSSDLRHSRSFSFGSSDHSHNFAPSGIELLAPASTATFSSFDTPRSPLPQYSLSSPAPSYISSFPPLPPTPTSPCTASSFQSDLNFQSPIIVDLEESNSLALCIGRLQVTPIPFLDEPASPRFKSPFDSSSANGIGFSTLRRTKRIKTPAPSELSSPLNNSSEELFQDLSLPCVSVSEVDAVPASATSPKASSSEIMWRHLGDEDMGRSVWYDEEDDEEGNENLEKEEESPVTSVGCDCSMDVDEDLDVEMKMKKEGWKCLENVVRRSV